MTIHKPHKETQKSDIIKKKKKNSFLHGHLFPYSNYLTVISCHCCIAQSLRLNISWVYTELRELYDWPQKEQLKIKISRIPS